MDEHPRIPSQRRWIEHRAEDILERVLFMNDGELRWTVRVLRDCLTPAEQQEMLRDWSEYLELHQMRQVVEPFLRRYTEHALAALEAKRFTRGTSLRDLTDEELQGMSSTEKWTLLQDDAAALAPDQVRRELARLFMCLTHDLFRDPALGEAAVEFTVYLDLLERLRTTSDAEIEALKNQVLAALKGLDHRDAAALEEALTRLREAIGRAVGFTPPFDPLFAERMQKWPRTAPAELRAVVNPEIKAAVEAMNPRQLRTSLRVLLEIMSLDEQQRELEPLRARYPTLDEIPAEALVSLLPDLSMRLGDRTICDFALRYRSGRLWARERIDPQVWKRLPVQDKFMVLEADNDAMDLVQRARHLTRLLVTERYESLFDPAYQVSLTHEPLYHRVVTHCLGALGDSTELTSLNRQVTRMMLDLEELVPEAERPARFVQIREMIGTGVKLGPPREEP